MRKKFKVDDVLIIRALGKLNDITPLKVHIKATDNLIDQIVYRLYGLTDAEIAIVEGQQSHDMAAQN